MQTAGGKSKARFKNSRMGRIQADTVVYMLVKPNLMHAIARYARVVDQKKLHFSRIEALNHSLPNPASCRKWRIQFLTFDSK